MSKKLLTLCSLLFLLPVLSLSGCLPKNSAGPRAVADDPVFLAELTALHAKGKTIIVAPSSGPSAASAGASFELAEKINACLPRASLQADGVPYHAAPDTVRLHMLGEALTDPDARVVWALRGGYGAGRLLPELAKLPAPNRNVILVGYSDITFLHLFMHTHALQTVHGSMVFELANPNKDPENFYLLSALLAGALPELSYGGLEPLNHAARQMSGPVSGIFTGGNLACFTATAGTPWMPDTTGKILFFEDVDEGGHRVDRMFTQLRQAGVFDGVKAVVLGSFTDGDNNTSFALERFADEMDKPVFTTDQFGHGSKNYPLVLNAPASVEPEPGGTFRLRIETKNLRTAQK
ncbi:LD-carboxypeptidase [Desulfovibrio sp. OttesenSCG-928-O18]|nr:LD-carboxypeptidase [Desulfovibrio sp. OttesenSCG-928-O18]